MQKLKTDWKTMLLATKPSSSVRIRQDIDAYFAGFFDGEGHISISNDPRRQWSYYVCISASQNDKRPLEMLVKVFGGKIHAKKRTARYKNQCYEWKCGGKDAFWALWRMLPWLIVKKEKARAAVIVLQHRPHKECGGQISQYQKTAIARAIKNVHVIRMTEKRWGADKNQQLVEAAH